MQRGSATVGPARRLRTCPAFPTARSAYAASFSPAQHGSGVDVPRVDHHHGHLRWCGWRGGSGKCTVCRL